jgi:type I restriction enzyme S subunit
MMKLARISDFCTTGTGGTPSRDKLDRYYTGGTIPWVKSGELRETVIQNTEEHLTEIALKETNVKLIPNGSLLLAMYGATVGRVGLLGIPATTNQAVCHIIPDSKTADIRYLFHALRSKVPLLLQRRVGGAQPNISQGIIKSLEVPVPPLPKQRRIAEVLDRAEGLRAKRRAALAELDSLTQAIFLEMFGPKGEFVARCTTSPLEALCRSINDGVHKTPVYVESGVPFITVRNITSGKLNFTETKFISISDHHSFTKRTKPEKGDILVSKDGTIGVPCPIDTDTEFSIFVSVALLKPRRELVDQSFLVAQFRSGWVQRQIRSESKGIAIRHLHLEDFKRLKFIVPPLSLQQEFARRAAGVQRLKATQRKSLGEMDALFASLQHRAFRGEL